MLAWPGPNLAGLEVVDHGEHLLQLASGRRQLPRRTSAYAKALLAATRQGDLLRQDKPKRIGGMTPEQMARMEREMASLTSDFRAIEASYGDDVLHLVVASGYLNRLLSNPAIERHLTNRHPELVDEFRAIIAASSLDEAAGGVTEERRTDRSGGPGLGHVPGARGAVSAAKL